MANRETVWWTISIFVQMDWRFFFLRQSGWKLGAPSLWAAEKMEDTAAQPSESDQQKGLSEMGQVAYEIALFCLE